MESSGVENWQGYLCLGSLVFIALLVFLTRRSESASVYKTTMQMKQSRLDVQKLIDRAFPRSLISKRFNWQKREGKNSRLDYYGYYLPNDLGCLILLLTGIIPGYIILYFVAKQTEHVAFSFDDFDSEGIIRVEARGLLASRIARQLAQQVATTS